MVMALQPYAIGLNPETGQDENLLSILAARRKAAVSQRESFTPGMKELLARNTATGARGAAVAGMGALSGLAQGYFNRQDAAAEQKVRQQQAIQGADFLRKSDPRFAKYPPGVLERTLYNNPEMITQLTGKAFEKQEQPSWQVQTIPGGKDKFNNPLPDRQVLFNPKTQETRPFTAGGGAPGGGGPQPAATPPGYAPPGTPQATVPQSVDSTQPLTKPVNPPVNAPVVPPPAGSRVLGQAPVIPGPDGTGNAAWASGKKGDSVVFTQDDGQAIPPGGPPLPPPRPPEMGLSPGRPVALAPNPDINPVEAAKAQSARLLRQQFPEQAVAEEQVLRKEAQANENYTRFAKSAPILNSMRKNWKDTSAVSDYDFIYGFAQILDPTSAVRDAEQKMLAAAQSAPEGIRAAISKALSGEQTLSTAQRQKVMEFLHNRVTSYKETAQGDFDQLTETVKSYGYSPERVVPRLGALPSREEFFAEEAAPVVAPQTQTQTPLTPEQIAEERIRRRGG